MEHNQFTLETKQGERLHQEKTSPVYEYGVGKFSEDKGRLHLEYQLSIGQPPHTKGQYQVQYTRNTSSISTAQTVEFAQDKSSLTTKNKG